MNPMLVTMAWRSIWRNRRRTLITMTSITFGVALTVFMVATAEGVYGRLIDDATRMQAGHITLQHPKYLAEPAVDLLVRDVPEWRTRLGKLPEVELTKALVTGQGLVKSAHGSVGAAIMGVEPRVERETSMLASKIEAGQYLDEHSDARVMIGVGMAKHLKLDVGKKLVITVNNRQGELVEELCRVQGIFRSGSDEIDGYLVQVPIEFARRLFDLPSSSASQVGIILRDAGDQARVMSRLQPAAARAGVAMLPWQRVLPAVAGWVQIDRVGGRIMEGLILLLILFTIFNTILMSVLERQREFAVLLAIGTSPGRLRRQVILESVMINLIGCSVGLLIGGSISYYFQVHGLNLTSLMGGDVQISGYAISTTIHPAPTWTQISVLGALVFWITVILSLYPVWRAPQVRIAEMVRAGK